MKQTSYSIKIRCDYNNGMNLPVAGTWSEGSTA